MIVHFLGVKNVKKGQSGNVHYLSYRTYMIGAFLNQYTVYCEFVYATPEPPKMAQFDWFAISGILGNIP